MFVSMMMKTYMLPNGLREKFILINSQEYNYIMKITLNGFAEHLLFAANVFIIFLLVFSDKINVPYWLDPFGRMHPMILHFPIVLLMLAMFMEFFRFKPAYFKEELYQNFTSYLLLSGTIFSEITVIMGLFLSKESGYSGSLL